MQKKSLTRGLLAVLAGLAAVGALATNIILPAFPAMSIALGTTTIGLTATLSTFFAVFAVGQLFVGPLSDRFGRRNLVLGGLLIFIVGSVVCALSDSLPVLIVGRIFQALGACATSVLSRAIARDVFDGNDLARALSLIMVSMAAAPGFSPLLGGALNSWLGWRSLFWFVAIIALVLALTYMVKVGETHKPDARRKLSVPQILKGYKQLAMNPLFILPALSVSMVIGSLYAFFSMAPSILMVEFDISPFGFGVFFASTVLFVFSGGLLAPRLSGKWGQVRAARAGMIIALLGGLMVLFGARNFPAFCVYMTVFVFGMGLMNPLGTAITLHPFGKQAGTASALLGFLQMSSAAGAVALGGNLGLSAYTAIGVIFTANLLLAMALFWKVR